ncbi:Levodione reductase [Lachnellula hyalina]|uniref:Levodione reductase n=1 Tax=Lachnellula hyalina TaxID=1316788 RepID=A0A8H8R2B0_9HELO|nr:Levodione reductase [Lachnellula hyalina]TVY27104.1 Levodione reductase [Lachnellula hyalina]
MTLFPGVALVTGAASGIGRATAIAFAVDGCRRIAICDRDLPGLEATRAFIFDGKKGMDGDVEVEVLEVDMLKEDDIERMVRETVSRWGRVDYAVNAAGIIGNNAPSTSTSTAQFDLVTNINYRGCWLSSRAELAQMLRQEVLPSHDGRPGERGSVVNIASQLGVVGRPNAREFLFVFPAWEEKKEAVAGG